jgi:type I restriction enzyme S subunit
VSQENLPEGWKTCTVEVIAKFIDYRGRTPSKTKNGIPLITAKNIRDGFINREPREYIAESDYDDWMTRGIPAVGDVVITTEAPMGNVALIDISEKFALAQRAICLQCGIPGIGSFLHYALRSPNFQRLLTLNATGTTVSGIKAATLKKLNIPLPPLAEQKVIADKLDTLLTQVETTKARLDRIPQILKTFRQSVLAAAVSGKLTKEWGELNKNESAILLKEYWLHERKKRFNEKQEEDIRSGKIKRPKKFKLPVRPDLETGPIDKYPETWALVSVSEFAECLDSERIPVKKDQRLAAEGLYPYFGANGEVDKVDEYIFDDELVLVTEDETFYGRVKPIAYRFSGKCWVNNHAHVLRAPTKIANDYLCFSLMYYKVIPWLSGTTGRAKLTQAALNSLPIGMPPEKEQTEIVRRVEELFAFADNIEQKAHVALERVNNLTPSILTKAFKGELTAAWRAEYPDLISGENSAEALLEMIKAEREALKKQPKKKTAARKKA